MRPYRSDHRNPRRLRYGWRLAQSGHVMVEPVQRRCIFLILELRRGGCTLQEICDQLSAALVPAPRRGAWYCATVKKIIDQNGALAALLPRAPERDDARPQPHRTGAGAHVRDMHQGAGLTTAHSA